METAYCLSLTLLLAAPLVTATDEEGDVYDSSYSYSAEAEGGVEEVRGAVLPLAPTPAPPDIRDILDDNHHMFRRKREADNEQRNKFAEFHNFEKKKGLRRQRIKDDLRIRNLLKTL